MHEFSRQYIRMHLNENAWILLKISLKCVPKVQINKIPALVQIMAWCQPGNKPLSEPMMVSLLMHICITQPQWVKQLDFFFQNVILFSNIVPYNCDIFCLKLAQYNEYSVSTVDTGGLVLQHQGISSYNAEYASICFQWPLLLTWFNFNLSMDK